MRDIGRMVIERVAPQELVIFHPESRAYFKDPQAALEAARKRASAKPKDREAGYGAAELMDVLTPFALAVAGAVVEPLVVRIAQSATLRTREAAQTAVRRLFRREQPAGTEEQDGIVPIVLSAEERSRLWQQAYQEGLGQGLDDTKARRLADGLIDGLDEQPGT
ncbi:hypothetical protein ACIA6D_10700 [Streptomyces cacaoi]|uniref:hypothetical protein n=1 Tax=Streptomyces cacaoi TaxID=1898 RepID=UPI003749B2DB